MSRLVLRTAMVATAAAFRSRPLASTFTRTATMATSGTTAAAQEKGSAVAQVSKSGAFARSAAVFRNHVEAAPDAVYPATSGRYHLYVSLACPWAHRCLIVRSLKKLESHIGFTVVAPTWQRTRPDDPVDQHCGWVFTAAGAKLTCPSGHRELISDAQCSMDPHHPGVKCARDLYDIAVGGAFPGPYTVPMLWDLETSSVVSNESSEIVRMLNTAFDGLDGVDAGLDLYPEPLRAAIDTENEWIYNAINNGVYKCGFARSQEAYQAAVDALFEGTDRLEAILSKQRYVASSAKEGMTEADVRAYVTCVRFDEVYVVYFKCNKRPLSSYPAIRGWMRELYQNEAFSSTTSMEHIKNHYFTSHAALNQYAVVPHGPGVLADLALPHGRDNVE